MLQSEIPGGIESLLQYLNAGVVVHSADGRVLNANENAARILGMELDRLPRHSIPPQGWSIVGDDGTPLAPEQAPFARVLATGQPVREMVAGVEIPGHGPRVWIQLSAFPEFSPAGSLDRVVVVFVDITARKRAEEALQASRATLDAALASMTDAVFISDANGAFVDSNDAFASFHRFASKAECRRALAAYADILEVYMPDGTLVPLEQWAVPRALRGETVVDAEYGLRRKDTGETWICSFSFGPIRDVSGTIVGSVVVGRDITRRKNAERALRESEQRFERSFHGSPAGQMLTTLPDGVIVEINDAYLQVVGYRREELVGRTTLEAGLYAEPADREKVLRAWRDEGRAGPHEIQIRTRDGEERTVLGSFQPVELGGVPCAISSIVDITERKRVEEALARSEERFRRTFHASPAGQIITTIPEGRILEINDAYLRIVGYSREECVGRTTLEIGLYAEPKERAELVARVIDGETLKDHELQLRTRSGDVRTMLANLQTIELGGLPCMVSSVVDVTDRLLAEQRRSESDQRYRLLFENAGILAVYFSPDGRIELMNRMAAKAWGGTPERFEGLQVSEVFGEFSDSVMARIHRAMESDELQTYESLVRLPGGPRWVQSHYRRAHDADGRPIGVQAVVIDVTERRQAEEKQRASDVRHRLLFENSGMAVAYVAPDGTISMMNSVGIEWLGARAAGAEGRTLLEVFGPEVGGAMWERVQRAMASGELLAHEDRLPTPDGHHWFHTLYHRIVGPDGALLGAQVVSTDITPRKLAEIATQESEARFRTLVATAPDGIFVQCDGIFRFVNPALVTLLGARSEAELLGTSFLERTAPEFHPMVQERIRVQRETGRPVPPAEQDMLRMDGSHVTVETVAVPVRFEGRDGHLVFVRDTSTRRAEERERESLREQLLQAQKMESVGRLAGGVAHDFNNLLVVILNYADFALHALHTGDPLRRDILEIRSAGERAAALTNQLLAFSRKQVLEPVSLALNEIPRGLEKMLRRIIGEDIVLELLLAPDAGVVVADRNQLEQVLINLVTNSRDAMPRGGRLAIATRNLELDSEAAEAADLAPGKYVELSVSDTGAGMDEATRVRVFEPFFTTKQIGQGTGLGLATVYGIVRQSGGSVVAESTPGSGTIMRVRLPRDRSALRTSAPAATAERPSGTETVLVVEDEAALRQIVCRLLEASGYTVLTAAGRDEALALATIRKERVDLLLTDVVMPKAAGPEVARALTQHWPQLRVLYMSGYAGEQMAKYGVDEMAGRLLLKPFTGPDLLRKVREALD